MENMVKPLPINLPDFFKGKRVLVTGHTGFKGSWLSFWLKQMNARVTGLALRPEYPRSHFELLGLNNFIHHVEADLRDMDRLRSVISELKPEIVFHLAAQAIVRRSYKEPKLTFDTNFGGSLNLLEAVRHTDSVQVLIYVTSDKCYLNKEWVWGYRENDELGGHDPYSASKAAAELAYKAYVNSYFQCGPPYIASVRAGNVIGGGDWADDRIIPDCIRALEAGKSIIIRNPNATRPWQHVLDPLHGYLSLAAALANKTARHGDSWNFGPDLDKGRTVQELAAAAVAVWGSGSVKVKPANADQYEHRLLQLSIDKAKLELGWRPRWNGDQAINAAIAWYKRVLEGEPANVVSAEQISKFLETAT